MACSDRTSSKLIFTGTLVVIEANELDGFYGSLFAILHYLLSYF